MFGKFTTKCDQQLIVCSPVHKVQELLCYLVLHRDRALNRELLADTLWNKDDALYSRKYLRKTLWQLQSALHSIPCTSTAQILIVDPQWIQFNSNETVWLDVAIFEQVFTLIKNKMGKDLNREEYQSIQQAVDLYRGDLLEGWFQDWCIYDRERFREMFLIMVEKLMAYYEANNEYELGIEFGNIILGYDRARERTHQRIMQLYYWAGNRIAALRQFESCRRALKEELGVEPSNRTLALFNQIVKDDLRLDQSIATATVSSPDNLVSSRVYKRLERIEELIKVQSSIQEKLEKEIQGIENELKGQI